MLERDGDSCASPIRCSQPLPMRISTRNPGDASTPRLAELVGDDEERARHHALATDGPDAGVAAELERAAHHARQRGASSAAAELGERALHLTPDSDHAAIHRRRITAALYSFDSGDPERALVLLEEALAAAATGDERAEALATLSRLHRYQGDQPLAAALARRALDEPDAGALMRAEAAQGLAAALFFLREDLEEAVRFATLGAELAADAGDERIEVESLCVQGLLKCLVGRPDSGPPLLRAVEIAEPAAQRRVLSSPPFNLAVHALWTDSPSARELIRDCLDDAIARGDEGSAPMVLAQLAQAEYLAGRWEEAARVAGEGFELSQQTGQRPMEAYSLATRALVRASLGLEEEARADAERALELAGERGMAAARIHGVWALGVLELSLGHADDVRAGSSLPSGNGSWRPAWASPGRSASSPTRSRLSFSSAGSTRPSARLAWLAERGRSLGRVSALVAADRCEGFLHAGRGDGEQALAAFERGPCPAWSSDGSVRTSADAPRPRGGAAPLEAEGTGPRDARTGARGVRGAGRGDLGGPGPDRARKHRRARPSESGLTPAEARVAALVAEGKTNREVAAALFVTEHTVEFHLSRIYRKLGVRSRAELARRFQG